MAKALNEKQPGDCGYIAFYNWQEYELYAASKWAAVELARTLLKVPKSKRGLLSVELAERADNSEVIHSTGGL